MSCEYCFGGKPLVEADEEIGLIDARIDGGKLVIKYSEGHVVCDEEEIPIGFCPKCGTEIISFG